jgi:copper chaperone NosL
MKSTLWQVFTLLSLLFLTACSETPAELQAAQKAMAIESHEECHLCGMIISGFPGPKGQLYERGKQNSLKFCSTRDMFAYLLDPEHQHAIQTSYVHDMVVMPWQHSEQETYIDARQAWYVVGHNNKGAMGPTLASFSNQQVAITFAEQHGGQIYRFEDVNQQLLQSMQ